MSSYNRILPQPRGHEAKTNPYDTCFFNMFHSLLVPPLHLLSGSPPGGPPAGLNGGMPGKPPAGGNGKLGGMPPAPAWGGGKGRPPGGGKGRPPALPGGGIGRGGVPVAPPPGVVLRGGGKEGMEKLEPGRGGAVTERG